VVNCVVANLQESDLDAPASNELEITFLGPGFGECALMHMGQEKWIVVDSCIDVATRSSLALDYLSKIGVSFTSVFMVVATHWHDDHIRGISQIVEASPGATFVCSAAVQKREFFSLVASARRTMSASPSGVKEMTEILRLLAIRHQENNAMQGTPVWAKENSLLCEEPIGSAAVRVQALSPSDLSMTRAWQSFARLVPTIHEPKRVLPAPSPNEASIVLWVTVDDIGVLFGGDLEEGIQRATGWKRVVDNPLRRGTASVFKVPHHGSSNAFNHNVWKTLLTPDPIAAVVPFRNGNIMLPKAGSIALYCSLTENVFITAPPGLRRTHRRSGSVEKLVRMYAGRLSEVFGARGVVRVRLNSEGNSPTWRVGLIQPAYKACV
jgi:beta-lactamase superfamily II metal-dependent hydrolase